MITLRGKVIGLGKVAITLEHSITNALHVDSLKYNLLFVSQLCEMNYNCLFTDKDMEVSKREDSSIVFTGRLKSKLYLVDFNKSKAKLETCLVQNLAWVGYGTAVKRSRFFSKGKSTYMIYNVVDHESNPSHYQLSPDIIVIHRRL
jgi:hypothetical protein